MQYFGFDRPSFGVKTFGFGESSPKLQADFTTETYKASGADKTFADLFTFTRAGKAWLVKDTGLQEYAADVPRLDDGLLIEQSATNVRTLPYASSQTEFVFTEIRSGTIQAECVTPWVSTQLSQGFLGNEYPDGYSDYLNQYLYSAIHRIEGNAGLLLAHNGAFGVHTSSVINDSWLEEKKRLTGISNHRQRVSAGSWDGESYRSNVGDYVIYADAQYIITDNYRSFITPIKTSTTPVTRPADYLLNKITGTTVTGDWDSTLTLSIVDGQLVHSGYGRIRSLEIN